ncbi:50S ribosomal protein L25/general stress protein Ctc [Streptomyces albus]|uniref:Large ribosomal subunit protein bL25 n=1 Tax=Streptomyces albus TaxID=1888 RepID=A0A6C1C3V8_9ACTN|nr:MULTISPECIES: 50S ribosomal protein L25/general stress protein Ctc [Streptomyces]KPC94564.1 50S ribosomal protein L25 [Streptomyces sp. NRRL F-6602]EPD90644.1 ribosomal protein L25, Ctc-form [Streptomyces sp. HPH0547]MDI6410696.1 50S ribosomal protein L25/general stress protein Ctc [Streptomyces albus]QID36727.1 50S ribosomal protein L25/general stress protein Ctc [Streptomyces albus]TGG84558.1 50S ribosomal protein L25/general stress protein Ctc [Streptomyces albus]
MADVNINATIRKEFGKGASRRLRREEKIPAVIYGHGSDPVHVELPSYDMMMALKTPNVLIHLDVDGDKQLVIPKAVQREAIRQFLVHVDLLVVKQGEKVQVEVPIHIEGELAPGQNLLEHVYNSLPVEAEATHIPESVTVSVEGLGAGDSILAKDVKLPGNTTLAIDGEETVIQVLAAQAEEPAAEGAEGEAEGAE